MKNSLKSLQFIGFLFSCIAGVLLHYVFVWSGGNIIVACFSPINESIWEHAKLIFFSMLIFALFTFMPPELPLFKDTVTGTYGFFAKTY